MDAPVANSDTDAALKRRIDAARDATLTWLDSVAFAGGPKGVMRISHAHDADAWPGVLLPGTYNGILCRELIDGLDRLDGEDRATLVAWFEAFRTEDGRFRMTGMHDTAVFKKPDRDETWRYIDFHVTNYSLAAIEALNPDRIPNLIFARPWLDPIYLKAWLADRDLRDPWQEGNNIVNLASFLAGIERTGDAADQRAAAATFPILFDWHDRLQEPTTGFWGVGQSEPDRRLEAVAGAVHNYHLWYSRRRPIPYHERAIDYALTWNPAVFSACIDVDMVDLLAHAALLTDYRRSDIETWLHRMVGALLDAQNPDGGFCDEREGVRRQDGWVGGYEEPHGISNTFATWFRWIAIAMAADVLWPGWRHWRFRRSMGIGYRLGGVT